MISNELLEEVIAISLKEEYLNSDLLIRIANNIIEQTDNVTKTYFNDVIIVKESKKNKHSNGECYDGIVYIYYLNIINNAKKIKKLSVFKTNLFMIQIILHEIEHLKSHFKELKNDFESKLIKCSTDTFILELLEDNINPFFKKNKDFSFVKKYLLKKYSKFYLPIWDICPEEKIAEVDSCKVLLDSVNNYSNFKEKNKEEYNYLEGDYFDALFMGYSYIGERQELNVPLLDYLNKIKKIDVFGKLDPLIEKELTNIKNYSLEEKTKYGMPILAEEFKVLRKKYLGK